MVSQVAIRISLVLTMSLRETAVDKETAVEAVETAETKLKITSILLGF